MQIQVRNIRADKARRGDAHLRVHVRAIKIHLAAELMHNLAHFTDGFFVHPVGGRIRDHNAGQFFARVFGFSTQIGQVDIAVFIARDDNHFHSRHLRGCRVSAVRRAWDQADITMTFVAAFVVMTNRQQAGVLALCAGVWLHAECVITGQLHQPVGELVDHLMIPFRLFCRAERVQLREFRPGNRNHFCGGVQLHGAGTQRDHRLIQRQIFALQRVHITHHLGFAVIAIEYRVSQNRIIAQHAFLNRAAVVRHFFIQGIDVKSVRIAQQDVKQILHVLAGRGLIQRDADGVENIATQVDLCGFGARQHTGFIRDFNTQGVKVMGMAQLQAFLL
ncbi:hypothetical protein D3C80_1027490 [compost metagenome]